MELWNKERVETVVQTGKRLHEKVRMLGAKVPVAKVCNWKKSEGEEIVPEY